MIATTCHAILFDAVGTLIHPEPSAGAVYAEIGRRFGSRHSKESVRARFVAAFARQESLDQSDGLRTDEARERRRWWAIVREVLDDVDDHESCFDALHAYFARPEAWRVDPDAAAVLTALARRGLTIGIASNFDSRLRTVAAGLPELSPAKHLLISSELGWRKPAREFFAAACRCIGHLPENTVFVGDDPENDLAGARRAGLVALLLDPRNEVASPTRIEKLTQLLLL